MNSMKFIYFCLLLTIIPGCSWFKKADDSKADIVAPSSTEKTGYGNEGNGPCVASPEKRKRSVSFFKHNSFMKAIARGAVEDVNRQIAAGVDVNKGDKKIDDMTPLMLASDLGDIALTKILLDAGAQVNTKSREGLTPLMFAAGAGCDAIVRELIDHGANLSDQKVNDQDGIDINIASPIRDAVSDYRDGELPYSTPLMFAVVKNHPQVVKTLIEKGFPKELINKGEYDAEGFLSYPSPFLLACRNGQPEIVELLIKAGVNLAEWLEGALFDAVEQISFQIYKQGIVMSLVPPSKAIEVVKILLQHGAKLVAEEGPTKTVLHSAVAFNNYEMVKYILDRVSEEMPVKEFIAIKNKAGKTALDIAQKNLKRYSKMTEKQQAAIFRSFQGDREDRFASKPFRSVEENLENAKKIVELLEQQTSGI